jgi:DNA-binding response OmpR family regulator
MGGNNEYLSKPFVYAELLLGSVPSSGARSGARRAAPCGSASSPSTRRPARVRLAGRPVTLAAKEFALLQALAADPTRVHHKNDLLRDVWGYASLGTTRTLDAHACRLRRKLSGTGRPFVLNVRGVGYCLTEAT